MRLPEIDWSVLRGSLVFAGIAIAVSAALVIAGFGFQEAAQARFDKEQRRFQANSRRYLTVDEEERLIGTYLPRYRSLETAGVVGEEQRLAWVETLREVSAGLGLPGLRFEVMPQRDYQPLVPVSTGSHKLYASTMRVSLDLLHEEDLLRFLDALTARALGRFDVERCALRRVGTALQTDPTKANVSAECDLVWYTLRKPKGDETG
jgi:hypothetical protein